ncbi:GNAT family N-acetyltransferase [uncultured Oscillibacter sp.]|uniref:GNAT family N-acetyltransferase n=1 Tax=uncultured Oscillibacter sp. TaxID=876091 RepID=UPI00345CB593
MDGRPLPANLSLEPLTAAHREGLAALWGDERVIRYTAIASPCGAAETEARLAQYLTAQAALPRPTVFAVTLDGRFCGAAGCLKTERENTFGLFYQLLPEVWGRGIGMLSARMALAALLRQRPQALVLADAAVENPASVRILKRLGFERTGVRRERGMEVCGFQLAPDGGLRA